MLQGLERRNDEVWASHGSLFEDATHVVGGAGIGLLASLTVRKMLPIITAAFRR